jgi:hypothetical protein
VLNKWFLFIGPNLFHCVDCRGRIENSITLSNFMFFYLLNLTGEGTINNGILHVLITYCLQHLKCTVNVR